MNPVYSILESPYRWPILAGTSFAAGVVGTIMMIAYVWPHWLALTWFYVGLAITLYCLARWGIEWFRSLESQPLDDASTASQEAGPD